MNTNTHEENLAFLVALSEKTVESDVSGAVKFTSYRISSEDFQKVIDVICGNYLLMPKTGFMGLIDGYDVINKEGKLILRFGEKNLPAEYTLREVFLSIVRSAENLQFHQKLFEQKKVFEIIESKFGDYRHY